MGKEGMSGKQQRGQRQLRSWVSGRVDVGVIDGVSLTVVWTPYPSWFLCKELASPWGTGKPVNMPAVVPEE